MHPGIIASNFYDYGDESMHSHLDDQASSPPEHAARTIAWLASAPEAGLPGGRYFHECGEAEAGPQAHDDTAARQLWDESEAILARLTL